MSEAAVWAIIGLPLAAFVMNAGVVRPLGPAAWRAAGYVTVAAIAGSLAISVIALNEALGAHGEPSGFATREWLRIGDAAGGLTINVGVLLDPLSAVMLIVVSSVSLLVQVYSLGYMRKDVAHAGGGTGAHAVTHATPANAHPYEDFPRYFAYMGLFTASMLGLVLARSLIQLYVFWELVGLSSYLLIGFYHWRPTAAAAAKKAFIVTRIGDFGFLLALLYLFLHRGDFALHGLNPFEIPDLHAAAERGLVGAGVLMWVALGLFAGAVGKSAQFPLHTWLPDAMEGPTPVSSLIHAATMVAAGVFLVARMFPLFEASDVAMNTVALVGGFTAVFAATMGLVATDIKRVLAYSTVSQLGYMMLALGVGAPAVAMFHLFNHAFFKCLLFLSAGSVHHAAHTFDMRYMGGLRRVMPITYVTMLTGALSLAGVFPLAGFWSKDEVLTVAWSGEHAAGLGVSRMVFVLALAAAVMTAFYIFRLLYLTFHGAFRGGLDAVPHEDRIPDEAHAHVHLGESPAVMLAPMVVLAGASVASGFLANAAFGLGPVPAHWFGHFLGEDAPGFQWWIAVGSTVLALGGIALATAVYLARVITPESLALAAKPLYALISRRYLMDDFYEGLIVRRLLYRGLFQAADWADRRLVDGTVDLVAWFGRNTGRALAQLQSGQVQAYGVAIALGVVTILLVSLTQR